VAFREDLTDGIDNHFDAMKMIGNANLSIYTVVDNKNLVIDGYGELNTNRVIRLGINAKAAETHTIELSELENMDPSVLIFLENIETGEFHNLRLAPSTFQGGANVHGELFNIHFKEPVKLTASNESCDFGVGKININIPTEGWNYKVKNNDGLIVSEANNVIGQGIIDNLNAGNYTIIMTYTDGYSFEKFVTIDAAVPIRSSFVVSENEVSIANAIVEFNANIEGATEFHWDFGDGNMISDINNPVHAYMMAGEYTVTLTAKNETCTSISTSSIKVSEVTTNISNFDNQNEVLLYPNPAIDHSNVLLNVDKAETQVKISIYDVSGRLVSSTNAKDVRSGSTTY
jgi:flagellar hook assembly protein FlgD